MGMYDDVKDMITTSNSDYVKIKSGDKTRLRILDHPYVSLRQFRPGDKPSLRFTWAVWDYSSEKVRLLEQGAMVYGQVADIIAEYGESMPMECDLIISRSGEDLQTRYNVVSGRVQGNMSAQEAAEQMPPMSEVVKGGVTLHDYRDGKKPEVQGPDGNSGYQGEEVPIEVYDEQK